MKKRHKYGTVLIDVETRKIIDMVKSRDYEDIKLWLSTFPNLKIVSRDGSISFNKAILESHPNAIQVSDRFHILKNLTDYCKQYISRKFKKKVEIENKSIQNSKYEEVYLVKEKYKCKSKWDLICAVKDLRSKNYKIDDICKILGITNKTVITYLKIPIEDKEKYNIVSKVNYKQISIKERKESLISQVKKLSLEGKNMSAIANELTLDRRTVKKNLDSDGTWEHCSKNINKSSILDKYSTLIKEMHLSGNNGNQIYLKIKSMGYNGSDSSVRRFISLLRKDILENKELKIVDYIERKQILNLLYNKEKAINDITLCRFEILLERYNDVKVILEIVDEFRKCLFGKKSKNLDLWIEKYTKLDIGEINSFISGIKRDIVAVKNAIDYEHSNGLAEGKVNKIKVIKRIMYGRCNFETLRRKVLLLEK